MAELSMNDTILGFKLPIFIAALLIIGFTFGYVASYELVKGDLEIYKSNISNCVEKNQEFQNYFKQLGLQKTKTVEDVETSSVSPP